MTLPTQHQDPAGRSVGPDFRLPWNTTRTLADTGLFLPCATPRKIPVQKKPEAPRVRIKGTPDGWQPNKAAK